MSPRGSVVIYLLFSIVVATASGIGVYLLIRDQVKAEAEASARAPAPRPAPPAPPVERPAPPVEIEPEEPVPTVDPFDVADAAAVAPPAIDEPPATNAPIFGSPGLEGPSAAQEVERGVKRYAHRLQRCFEKALAQNSRIGGSLRLRFTIDRDGKVGPVTFRATRDLDPRLTTCVVEVIAKLRFPRPAGDEATRVVYPIDFWPAHGGDTEDVRPHGMPDPRPSAGCDEVGCVLDNYDRPCCEKFKR